RRRIRDTLLPYTALFRSFFSKRKPKSNWSKINKEKVQQLIDSKRMTKAGYESIATAKQNGYWTILDEVEELIIPKDLEIVQYPRSEEHTSELQSRENLVC